MPKFSVIIPLYNKENYIQKTLQSVIEQSFTDFEIIIVDDGSTDTSAAIVKSISDERIQYFYQENAGLSAARNAGIKKANGCIMALCDADDCWTPKHLEHLAVLAKHYPEASLYGTNWIMQTLGGNIHPKHSFTAKADHLILPDFFKASLAHPLCCPSALAFKKSIVEEVGYFDPKVAVGEDVDFLIRANVRYRFAYHQEASCLYALFSENQITTSNLGTKTIPNFDFYEQLYPEYKFFFDFKRYTYALKYKLDGNTKKVSELKLKIDLNHLNHKQRLLLNLPNAFYRWVKKVKNYLAARGTMLETH